MSKKNSILSLVLIFAIVFVIFPYQPASAQAREITSYCYLNIEPNPVGVGQTTYISLWVDAALPYADYDNPVRRHDYKLTITDPDDSVAFSQTWDVVFDTTGVTFTSFIPDKIGEYSVLFEYGGQEYVWNDIASKDSGQEQFLNLLQEQ